MGNTVHCRVEAGGKFTFELKKYLCAVERLRLEQLTDRPKTANDERSALNVSFDVEQTWAFLSVSLRAP